MGVSRNIPDHPGHPEVAPLRGLARNEGLCPTPVPRRRSVGRLLGQDDREWLVQAPWLGSPERKSKVKILKKILVGEQEIADIHVAAFISGLETAETKDSGVGFDLGDGFFGRGSQGGRRGGELPRDSPDRAVGIDPENALAVDVIPVEAQLVRDENQNQQATGDADGQSGDVDQRKCLVPPKIAQGDFQEVFQHGVSPE